LADKLAVLYSVLGEPGLDQNEAQCVNAPCTTTFDPKEFVEGLQSFLLKIEISSRSSEKRLAKSSNAEWEERSPEDFAFIAAQDLAEPGSVCPSPFSSPLCHSSGRRATLLRPYKSMAEF
jgi:hypothetical protein